MIDSQGRHTLYNMWYNIRARCYNPKKNQYKDYGGRGIKICKRWLDRDTFIAWCLNNGWKPGLQLDRRNNDGNYTPSNCRFVTPKENSNNQRVRCDSPTGIRGITLSANGKKFKAQCKNIYLGTFKTIEEAEEAYNECIRS